jgi:hypothetical protein
MYFDWIELFQQSSLTAHYRTIPLYSLHYADTTNQPPCLEL